MTRTRYDFDQCSHVIVLEAQAPERGAKSIEAALRSTMD
jgi:hypothetical protein